MEKPSKDAYYLCKSNMQKAIRRSLPDIAEASARIVHRSSPWDALRRLYVILFEDCGRNHGAVRLFREFRQSKYKDEDAVAMLARVLAEGPKSKDCGYLSWYARDPDAEYTQRADIEIIREMGDRAGDLIVRMDENPIDMFQRITDDVDPKLSGWVRMIQKKLDGEGQSTSYVYWHEKDRGVTRTTVNDELEGTPSDSLYGDLLLLSAVDGHTVCGKMALSAAFKQMVKELPRYTKDDLSMTEFYIWSCLAKKNIVDADGYCFGRRCMAVETIEPIEDWYWTNFDSLIRLKIWALGKRGDDVRSELSKYAEEML